MARTSKFTPAQVAHITTCFAELQEIYEAPGLAGCRDTTANDIVKSELFNGKLRTEEEDPVRGGSPAEWIQRIKEKFKKHVTTLKKKATGPAKSSTTTANVTPDAVALHPAASGKSFFHQDTLTTQKLFEYEQKSAINTAAATQAEKDKVQLIARFHPCKKELWDALSDAQHQDYKNRAEDLQKNVGVSQTGFSSAIGNDMSDFVASGQYGRMTMTLLYSYRTPADELFVGCTSAATAKNGPHFHKGPDGKALIEMWKKHSEGALPRCLEHITKTAVMPDIPLNAEGIPVFPRMNLMETPPAGVFALPVYGCFVHMTAVASPNVAILKKAIENFADPTPPRHRAQAPQCSKCRSRRLQVAVVETCHPAPPVLEIRLPRRGRRSLSLQVAAVNTFGQVWQVQYLGIQLQSLTNDVQASRASLPGSQNRLFLLAQSWLT
ncbi:hypothetical protein C8R44DRAFT_751458 [Mycena epipterygia]|nr:hypothetical protein C8R44DRAFT_751458 [Mycena epipterygia]